LSLKNSNRPWFTSIILSRIGAITQVIVSIILRYKIKLQM
ncbi:MAG: hypothetical protein ACJA1B_003023, partial [Polaribacter sp.]